MTNQSSTKKNGCFSTLYQAFRSRVIGAEPVKIPQSSDYPRHPGHFDSPVPRHYPHRCPAQDTAPQPVVPEVAAVQKATSEEVAAVKEAVGDEVTVDGVIKELMKATRSKYVDAVMNVTSGVDYRQSIFRNHWPKLKEKVAECGRRMKGNGHHQIFLEALAFFVAQDYHYIGLLPNVYWQPQVLTRWFGKYSREVADGNPAGNTDRVIPYGCKKWPVLKRMYKAYLAEQASAHN